MTDFFRVVSKILMWVLIIGFGANFALQSISYSFYRGAKPIDNPVFEPAPIQYNSDLSGYGYDLDSPSDTVVLFFGGSKQTAYNAAGQFGGLFGGPFLAADYYGSQQSAGKMNLASMKKTALDLYDFARARYPDKKIVVMGYSYGTGIAAYLASERESAALVLISAYRELADLYNRIVPIFWGPAKIFISNDIRLCDYAKAAGCPVFIIGSKADKTLGAKLQYEVKACFSNAEVKIFEDVGHGDYLSDAEVLNYIKSII